MCIFRLFYCSVNMQFPVSHHSNTYTMDLCTANSVYRYIAIPDVQRERERKRERVLYRYHNTAGLSRKMNEWWFRPQFCTILGRRQPGRMRWVLLGIMPLSQDRSHNLLASSPARYNCPHIPALSRKTKYVQSNQTVYRHIDMYNE